MAFEDDKRLHKYTLNVTGKVFESFWKLAIKPGASSISLLDVKIMGDCIINKGLAAIAKRTISL